MLTARAQGEQVGCVGEKGSEEARRYSKSLVGTCLLAADITSVPGRVKSSILELPHFGQNRGRNPGPHPKWTAFLISRGLISTERVSNPSALKSTLGPSLAWTPEATAAGKARFLQDMALSVGLTVVLLF